MLSGDKSNLEARLSYVSSDGSGDLKLRLLPDAVFRSTHCPCYVISSPVLQHATSEAFQISKLLGTSLLAHVLVNYDETISIVEQSLISQHAPSYQLTLSIY